MISTAEKLWNECLIDFQALHIYTLCSNVLVLLEQDPFILPKEES